MNANRRVVLTIAGWKSLLLLACMIGVGGICGAQGTTTTQPAKPKAAASGPIKLGASCVTAECHGEMKQAKFLHGPLNMTQCQPCHTPVNNQHKFEAPAKGRDLCLVCHEAEAAKAVVHKPFGADCTMCHNPHGSNNRYFVKGGLNVEGCTKCHSDVRSGLNHVHGPVNQGECLACHTPHQSEHKHLLVESPTQLCLSCHVDFAAKMEGAVSVHEPVKTDCSGCHNAHGGKNTSFLAVEGQQLCQSCHGDFIKKIGQFKHQHAPMVEGKACVACHQPHASNQERLLAGNNEELCLSCHNKAIQTKKGQIDDIASQLKNAKSLHGPLRQHNCIACHQAHGSDHPHILDKAFPAEFYTPFKAEAYDLCFACHDKKVVMNEKSTETGFRNGDRNLHHLHVNRAKGRSCRACHHEHASSQPDHVRTSVPFGRWQMNVEFQKTDTGGGCSTGCHVPYKYDRKNPVTYEKKS